MTTGSMPLSVLLVEDEPADAELIAEILRGPGRLTVDITCVNRLSDALEALDDGDFDAVLLDLSLPDTRGFEGVMHIRAHQRVPVVVLTGHDDDAISFAAIDAGAADFLVKDDVSRARLTRALYNAVQSARVADDLEAQRNLLESVLESLADAVVVIDPQGQVQMQNPAADRLLGPSPEATLSELGEAWSFDPATRRPMPRDTQPWSRAQRGETVDGAEIWLDAPNGGGRWLSANIRPFHVGGAHKGGVAVLRDITERRNRQAQVEALNDELRRQIAERSRAVVGLEAANRLKAQFLDIVSHELRTPLTPIVGYARLLLRKAADLEDGQRTAVQQICESGEQLQRIVDEILQFQTLRSEPVTVRPVVFETREMFRGLLEDARGKIGDAPVELTLHADGLPLRLVADAEQVAGIIRRLLDNAVTYTPHGRVELRARCDESDLIVEVRDSGVGIDAEHLDFIFGEFYQAESPMTRSHGGLGLGLAHARFLAEALGGELAVRSTPGRGSAFRLKVPAARPEV